MALKDSFRALRRRRRILVLVLVAMAAVAVAGALALRSGGGWATPFLPPASGSAGGGPVSHRSFLERVIPTPAERTTGPAVPRNLTDLAHRLPLERKVAELFVFGFTGIRVEHQEPAAPQPDDDRLEEATQLRDRRDDQSA